jgi:hypothetical protein
MQRPLTSGARVGQPTKSLGQPCRFYVSLVRDFMHTCLHEKGRTMAVEKVDGG